MNIKNLNKKRLFTLQSVINGLTVSRIFFGLPIIISLNYGKNDVFIILILIGCLTDFFDGYLARAMQQQSLLGKFLDPIADKLLVASLILMLVAFDRIPGIAVLPAVVILCRELLVSGLREFLAGAQVSLPVSRLAQYKTTLQMIMLGFLLVGSAGPKFGPFSTTDIGVVGLWVAATLTLITGYDYLNAGLRHVDEMDRMATASDKKVYLKRDKNE